MADKRTNIPAAPARPPPTGLLGPVAPGPYDYGNVFLQGQPPTPPPSRTPPVADWFPRPFGDVSPKAEPKLDFGLPPPSLAARIMAEPPRPPPIKRDPKAPGYPIKEDADYLKWRGQQAPFPERPISPAEQQMFDIIVRGEVEKDDRVKRFPSSYDVPVGYGPTPKPLTQMSIDEVMEFQKRSKAGTAMGGFQIKDEQLREAKKHIPLRGDETFDRDMQVKIIMDRSYWRRRYGAFLSGLITPTEFQEDLAKEFASVERPGTGKSRYGDQPAKTMTPDILPTLEALQQERRR